MAEGIIQMKILLIGNSGSVLNHKIGHIIDQYDIVCRFNNFELKGYEEYVGSKTDWVAYRACDDVKLYDPEKIQRAFFFIAYCELTPGMKIVAANQKFFYGNKGEIVDSGVCRMYATDIGLSNNGLERPSVGALAIAHFKARYEAEIYTHGFDGSLDGTITHYFKKQPKDSCYHDWKKEQDFAKRLGVQKLYY